MFGPSKYGIIPELVPHQRLSAANGVLEMGSNLAILSGMVAGAGIVWAARHAIGPLWVGGLLLAGLSACGLLAALTIPRVPARAVRGGLGTTVRIAWEAIRADRVLRLTVIGQVLVWAIASLVPAPILPYASKILGLSGIKAVLPLVALGLGIGAGCVLAGKLSGPKVEYGLLPLGALGLTVCTLAFAVIGPATARPDRDHGAAGDLQRAPVRPAQLRCCNGGRRPTAAARSSRSRTSWSTPACSLGSVLALVLATAGVSPRGTFLCVSIVLLGWLLLGADARPRRVLPLPPARPGAHDLSRAGDRPVERAGARAAPCWSPTTCRSPTACS